MHIFFTQSWMGGWGSLLKTLARTYYLPLKALPWCYVSNMPVTKSVTKSLKYDRSLLYSCCTQHPIGFHNSKIYIMFKTYYSLSLYSNSQVALVTELISPVSGKVRHLFLCEVNSVLLKAFHVEFKLNILLVWFILKV